MESVKGNNFRGQKQPVASEFSEGLQQHNLSWPEKKDAEEALEIFTEQLADLLWRHLTLRGKPKNSRKGTRSKNNHPCPPEDA